MANYYIDNIRGNDTTGNGSKSNPWKSLLKLRDGYGGTGHNFYLESGSTWEFITSRLDITIDTEVYNNGASGGINGPNDGSSRTVITNYYHDDIDTGRLPTVRKYYELLSNTQRKGFWNYDSNWNGWRASFYNYRVQSSVSTSTSELDLAVVEEITWSDVSKLPQNVLVPWAGCSATFTGTSSMPTMTLAGQTQPTTSTVVYLYPTSDRKVRVYATYEDALAGNSNYFVFSTTGAGVMLNPTPARGVLAMDNTTAVMFHEKWGIGWNQGGASAATFKNDVLTKGGEFKYSSGYPDGGSTGFGGGTDLIVWAPEDQDPVQYYGDVKLFQRACLSFWAPVGITIENIHFDKCPSAVTLYMGNGQPNTSNSNSTSKNPVEVRNCVFTNCKNGVNLQISAAPRGKNRVHVYGNYIYNTAGYGISGYDGTAVAGSIEEILIYNNFIDLSNVAYGMGGAIYFSTQSESFRQKIFGNTIKRAWNGVGNAIHDGCGIYIEFNGSGWLVYGNYIEDCPVAFQDNSGKKNAYIGNTINKCGVVMRSTDEGDCNSVYTIFNNNTIYDAKHKTENWITPQSVVTPRIQFYSYVRGVKYTCTFNQSSVSLPVSTPKKDAATTVNRYAPRNGARVYFTKVNPELETFLPEGLEFGRYYYTGNSGNSGVLLFQNEEDVWKGPVASFTGSITGNTLTSPGLDQLTYGRLAVGQILHNTALPKGTTITSRVSDTQWQISTTLATPLTNVTIQVNPCHILFDGTTAQNASNIRLEFRPYYEIMNNIFHTTTPPYNGLSNTVLGLNFNSVAQYGIDYNIQNNLWFGWDTFAAQYNLESVTDTSIGTINADPKLSWDLRPLDDSPALRSGIYHDLNFGSDLCKMELPINRGSLDRNKL